MLQFSMLRVIPGSICIVKVVYGRDGWFFLIISYTYKCKNYRKSGKPKCSRTKFFFCNSKQFNLRVKKIDNLIQGST